MMEKPYSGRAKIFDTARGFKIEIPAKKNWFMIIFMTGWLGGWVMGELFALGAVTGFLGDSFESAGSFFILFWLIAWTSGGFFAIRTWLWMIAGKEILSFNRNELIIQKKGAFLVSPKTYDLREIKNFQINSISSSNSFFGNNSNRNMWNIGGDGVLKFDYGLKTIQIASGIDEAEGKYLLGKIKSKLFIME